ncbi:thioredoxin [Streptomyces sp. R39]|uniref:Thioredoxin n=2 Tax=Streptomyces TaxID=1883 RepID=A0AB39QHU1_9ACTN
MPTVELTKDNFEETVTGSDIVLIDFWAAWCGPCRMFGPVYEKAAERHPDIVFGKVDTEAQPELAGAFRISSIPTLMAVRDRTVLYSQPGALPPQALEELIGKIRAVDMDDVRRKDTAGSAEANRRPGSRNPGLVAGRETWWSRWARC